MNRARRDLCGGCSAMGIPTAIASRRSPAPVIGIPEPIFRFSAGGLFGVPILHLASGCAILPRVIRRFPHSHMAVRMGSSDLPSALSA